MSAESRYHVHVRPRGGGLHRAWVFNLTPERLRAEVVEPWLAGDVFELGDIEWDPRTSELQILEGPALEGPDLAMGEGPNSANRTAEEVTERVLAKEKALPSTGAAPGPAPVGTGGTGSRAERVAATLLADLAELGDPSLQSEEALVLVTERLRVLGLD